MQNTASENSQRSREVFQQWKQVNMAILDFTQAFNTVRHKKLLHKLKQYVGPLHAWLASFLTRWSMRIGLERACSESTVVDSRVP